MYATVRRWKNAAALADAMSAKEDEVRSLIGGVSGFVSYYATRDGDTLTSISVFDDKAGGEESTRLAREWVSQNVNAAPGALEVSGGEVFINF